MRASKTLFFFSFLSFKSHFIMSHERKSLRILMYCKSCIIKHYYCIFFDTNIYATLLLLSFVCVINYYLKEAASKRILPYSSFLWIFIYLWYLWLLSFFFFINKFSGKNSCKSFLVAIHIQIKYQEELKKKINIWSWTWN